MRCFIFDTTAYANGLHHIAWLVVDSDGKQDGVGGRYFRIFNGTSSNAHVAAPAEGRLARASTVFPQLGLTADAIQEDTSGATVPVRVEIRTGQAPRRAVADPPPPAAPEPAPPADPPVPEPVSAPEAPAPPATLPSAPAVASVVPRAPAPTEQAVPPLDETTPHAPADLERGGVAVAGPPRLATDADRGTATDTFVMTVWDATPPVIEAAVAPRPDARGLVAGPATVTWTVTDPESEVVWMEGCEEARLAQSGTVRCTATNGAGQTATRTVNVRLDPRRRQPGR